MGNFPPKKSSERSHDLKVLFLIIITMQNNLSAQYSTGNRSNKLWSIHTMRYYIVTNYVNI